MREIIYYDHMAGLGQYLKDTQAELRHVAWPTRTQTIVYTVLVAVISIVVSLYLGLFDYIFTTALKETIGVAPAPSAIEVTQNPISSTTPEFNVTPDAQ
jgi:preprotein translocase SecE subunit